MVLSQWLTKNVALTLLNHFCDLFAFVLTYKSCDCQLTANWIPGKKKTNPFNWEPCQLKTKHCLHKLWLQKCEELSNKGDRAGTCYVCVESIPDIDLFVEMQYYQFFWHLPSIAIIFIEVIQIAPTIVSKSRKMTDNWWYTLASIVKKKMKQIIVREVQVLINLAFFKADLRW